MLKRNERILLDNTNIELMKGLIDHYMSMENCRLDGSIPWKVLHMISANDDIHYKLDNNGYSFIAEFGAESYPQTDKRIVRRAMIDYMYRNKGKYFYLYYGDIA